MSFGRSVAASFAIGVVITLALIGSRLDHFSAVAVLARLPIVSPQYTASDVGIDVTAQR